jgi:hypothetical protein
MHNKTELQTYSQFILSMGPENQHFDQSIKYIVTWCPKAGIVEAEETSIAREWLGKHIPTAMNTQAPTEELLFLCNSEVDTPL